ncbi:nucleoside-diphosphate kinase [archaeon]|nr:MAG: nucleoside-diphosphate kinase [archaeon]
MIERTLIILKPDAVLRGRMGDVISRFEQKGYRFVAMKLIQFDRALAERHYAEHVGKSFFDSLVDYICMSPVLVGVVEGEDAITVTRKLAGATHPLKSEPGTIRGDLGFIKGDNMYNTIHASDSPESAKREMGLFFSDEELLDYDDAKTL